MSWDRRGFLALLGVAASTSGAACLGGPGDRPGPRGAERFRSGCPPVDQSHLGRHVCSHTVDPDETSIYLLPASATTRSPSSLTLTLYNFSPHRVQFNPYDWTVWRRTDEGWNELERHGHTDGGRPLASGATMSWQLGEIMEDYTEPPGGTYRFEPGHYAASITTPIPGEAGDEEGFQATLALVRVIDGVDE